MEKKIMGGISFENVSVAYEAGDFKLKNIDLKIAKGSFTAIMGLNGSGKSTMTLMMNGIIPNQIRADIKGRVMVDGIDTSTKPVSFFAGRVGMLFQNPDYMLFNLTVREEIQFGLNNLKIGEQEMKIKKALAEVGMEGFENRDPQTLSLGQKQKICLANILALDTPYIVLDEPTAMLDHKSSLNLFAILKRLHKNGRTIIVVEHDTDYIKDIADAVVVVDQGAVIECGAPREVFSRKTKLKKLGLKVPTFDNE